jgi:hypothetical protein
MEIYNYFNNIWNDSLREKVKPKVLTSKLAMMAKTDVLYIKYMYTSLQMAGPHQPKSIENRNCIAKNTSKVPQEN